MTNENKPVITTPDAINSYFDPNHPEFQKNLEEERQERAKQDLQDLIITKDDLKQLKVLDKPTNAESCLVWITRSIAYEYGRGERGCRIPLNELNVNSKNIPAQFMREVCLPLEKAGYSVSIKFNMELIGDCLEIVWG